MINKQCFNMVIFTFQRETTARCLGICVLFPRQEPSVWVCQTKPRSSSNTRRCVSLSLGCCSQLHRLDTQLICSVNHESRTQSCCTETCIVSVCYCCISLWLLRDSLRLFLFKIVHYLSPFKSQKSFTINKYIKTSQVKSVHLNYKNPDFILPQLGTLF